MATFDVFSRLQVTNYGLFDILFELAPNGSEHVDVWLWCILAQTVSPQFISWQRFSDESRRGQAEKLSRRSRRSHKRATSRHLMSNPSHPRNEAEGISDIEGKVARVSGEGIGQRPSFKSVVRPSGNLCLFVSIRGYPRFAGNRFFENRPVQTRRRMSRRKRIHQSTPFFTFGTRRNAFHSAATQLLTLAAFRKFWQRLVKGDPRQLIFEPDRFLRHKRRGIIERRDRHINDLGIFRVLEKQMRAATCSE